MSVTRTVSCVVVTLAGAALLASVGCSPRPEPTPPRASGPVVYGITETSDRIAATGILMRIDDGVGLYFAIADRGDPISSQIPPLIAILANPEDVDAAAHTGETVCITGVQDPFKSEDRHLPNLRAESLTVLSAPDEVVSLEQLQTGRMEPGIRTLVDGRSLVTGEVSFFDTPEGRIWGLRRPTTDPHQRGVSYIALVDNLDTLGLQERQGLVAIKGSLVESGTAPLGLPVLHADGEVHFH